MSSEFKTVARLAHLTSKGFVSVRCALCTTSVALRESNIGRTSKRKCTNPDCRNINWVEIPGDWQSGGHVTVHYGGEPGSHPNKQGARPARRKGWPAIPAPESIPAPEPAPEPTPPPTPPASDDVMRDLLARVAAAEARATNAEASAKAALEKAAAAQEALPNNVVVTADKVEVASTDTGGKNPAFERAFAMLCVLHKVMLVGPAGTGKTTMAEQMAEALGLNFGALSCSEGLSEAHVLGRPTAQGAYLPSNFVTLFEKGGVYLLDESDAMDANMALVMNSALANGYISIPNRTKKPMAKRHDDFYLVACANTFGKGSSEYVGRTEGDQAFLDRFVSGKVYVDYDLAYEKGVAKAYGIERYAEVLWKVRANVQEAKIKEVVSTRALQHAGALHKAEPNIFTLKSCLDDFFMGWSEEEKFKALHGVDVDVMLGDGKAPTPSNVNGAAPRCTEHDLEMVRKERKRDGAPFWGCPHGWADRRSKGCTNTQSVNA